MRPRQLPAANAIRFPLGERLLFENGKPVGDRFARLDGGADDTKQHEPRGGCRRHRPHSTRIVFLAAGRVERGREAPEGRRSETTLSAVAGHVRPPRTGLVPRQHRRQKVNENNDDSKRELKGRLKSDGGSDGATSTRLVEATLANESPEKKWVPLHFEQIAEILSDVASVSQVPSAAGDIEPAVRALKAAGTVVLAEHDGVTCFRLRRQRKNYSPWKGWKLWAWEQIDAAIRRTTATAKNGAALQDAVNDHIAKVNAVFIRLNADYQRKEREIEEAEFDPTSRKDRLDRLFADLYGVKRGLKREADRVLITMLILAAAE